MTSSEVRRRFVEFWLARDHHRVPSAPLVPRDDPTLLFTSAGMVQFKKYYSGSVPLPFRRAVTVQKCLRVTDIEDVGRTPRHDTFFEMLGHFSFGDYFKPEAIVWNWEFFTRELGIDPERLTASVFEQDHEAYRIWRDVVGLPPERIVHLTAKDNFWGPAGGTGACGPCSELYFDLGPELDPRPEARAGDDTDRFVEVGNLVFPQFDRQADGSDLPLQNRGIDTGIGLERLVMVVQGKTSIFQTDLFWPLVEEAARVAGVAYAGHEIALHIIADHARALSFALSEGVLPSNEGRGYVIRRLIRRAAVQGWNLGRREPFLHRLVDRVVEMMREPYPEVAEGRERTVLALRGEEERFGETLDQSIAKLQDLIGEVERNGAKEVPGEAAFLLHDTYGLPLEVTVDFSRGRGLTVDHVGFERCMTEQKERSRASASFALRTDTLEWRTVCEGAGTEFRGYDEETSEARVLRWAPLPDGEALVVLDRTPFYGESGGQVGDTGRLRHDDLALEVRDTLCEGSEIRHRVSLVPGATERLSRRDAVWEAVIDGERRAAIRRHHTATHLLQSALRRVLGQHVAQAGSRVAPDRLRFDFTHFAALTPEQRREVERLANDAIVRNLPVGIRYSTYDEAVRDGVTALFGEKYDIDRVRRVKVAGLSEELCGGTHVAATGEIGALLILEESAVAAGTRRIEAVCGLVALKQTQAMREGLGALRRLLGTTIEEAPTKIQHLQEEIIRLRKDLSRARAGEGSAELDRVLAGAEIIGDARFVVGGIQAESVNALREAGDQIRKRLGRGGALLAATIGEKTSFLAVVTDDLVREGKLKADEIVRRVAGLTGGSGGGRPQMALGGAGEKAPVAEALEEARRLFRQSLG
jgi:alanyl-tRNA synthetase